MDWVALVAALILAPATPLQESPGSERTPADSPNRDVPPRLAVELADVDWQPLPRGVWNAKVSPDGRLWLMVARGQDPLSRAQVQERWQREYEEQVPQVEWGMLVLFEPSDNDNGALQRAWYAPDLGNRDSLIWGYDGQRWVEREAPAHAEAGGGGRWYHEAAVVAAGRSWFFSGVQAASFDGSDWQSHELMALDRSRKNSVTVRSCVGVADDLFVWISVYQDSRARLFRWKDGKWADLWTPPALSPPQSMVACEDELLFLSGGRLYRVPFQRPAQPPQSLLQDIELLADADFQAREAATARLINTGKVHLPYLREKAAEALHPERRNRLRLIVALLEGGSGMTGPAISHYAELEIDYCSRLYRSLDHSIRITGNGIREGGREHGPAEVVLHSGGVRKIEPLGRAEASLGYTRAIAEVRGPGGAIIRWEDALSDDHKPPENDRASRWSFLTRTAGGAGPARVPLRQLHWVVAALPDGSVIVSDRAYRERRAEQPLVLFQPEKPQIPRLHGMMRPGSQMRASPDGSVWVRDGGGHIYRFEGVQWDAPLDQAHLQVPSAFAPLGDGLVLFAGAPIAALYDGHEAIDTDQDVRRLIERNAPLLRQRLRHPEVTRPREVQSDLALSVDAAGNIWLCVSGELKVLADGKWLDVGQAINAKRPHFKRAEACIPVADGDSYYVTDFAPNAQFGTSVVAKVLDGEISFRTLPNCTDELRFTIPVYERETGALYVPFARTPANSGFVEAHGTIKIGRWSEPDGSPAKLEAFVEGVPWLFDEASSLLWLRHTLPYRTEAATRLVAEKQTVADIRLPGLSRRTNGNRSSIALAHRSGAVFVVTSYGLLRLTRTPGVAHAYQAELYLPDYAPSHLKDARLVKDSLVLLFDHGIVQTFEVPTGAAAASQ